MTLYHLRRTKWLDEHGPCALCGSTDDLEVDHVDPSQKESHRIWSWSDERREAELAKCRVLCRPCHEKRHAEMKMRHGESRYRKGCRCDVCKAANLARHRRELELRKARDERTRQIAIEKLKAWGLWRG